MAGLVGVILVLMALFSVGAVLFMVMREHPEQEEWYIPDPDSRTGSTNSPMSTAEVVGAQMTNPSPVIDDEAKPHNAD